MKSPTQYPDIVLSSYPVEVTARGLATLIARHADEDAKTQMTDFIYHRLHRRYIVPLSKVPVKYKSGFLIMATACLLIETLQSFFDGTKETPKPNRDAFKEFFKRENANFPGLADDPVGFYISIRCGILHQAETKNGYRLTREMNKPLFDKSTKTINANKFLESLDRCLERYIETLRLAKPTSVIWKNAVQKLGFICDNCKC
jgi:hypothetical protein